MILMLKMMIRIRNFLPFGFFSKMNYISFTPTKTEASLMFTFIVVKWISLPPFDFTCRNANTQAKTGCRLLLLFHVTKYMILLGLRNETSCSK